MGEWHKTGCVLCAQNCGIEVYVENNRMIKVKPDKSNPRSQGYVCRKGLNIIYHQYPDDRLTEPLMRIGDRFESVSWDQAIDEIAGKLRELVEVNGPRCLAYMGGSSQGGPYGGSFRFGHSPDNGLPILLLIGRTGVLRLLVGNRPCLRQAI